MHQDHDLKSLEKGLSQYILYATAVVFCLILAVLIIVQAAHTSDAKRAARYKVNSTLQIYTSNLLSRVGIIVTATEFLEFVRSDEYMRKKMVTQFSELLSRIPKQDLNGFKIADNQGQTLYEFGNTTDQQVAIHLCYIGDMLNGQYGDCFGKFYLFLSKENLIAELARINPGINVCKDCPEITSLPLLPNDIYKIESNLTLKITETAKMDWKYFISLSGISLIGLIIISLWVRSKIKSILLQKIINPISSILSPQKSSQSIGHTVSEINALQHRENLLVSNTYQQAERNIRLSSEIRQAVRTQVEQGELLAKNQQSEEMLESIYSTGAAISALMNCLYPESIEVTGLKGALQELIESWSFKNKACHYRPFLLFNEDQFSPIIKLAVYNAAQAFISHTCCEAGATVATIKVTITNVTNKRFAHCLFQDNSISQGTKCNEIKKDDVRFNNIKNLVISMGGEFNTATEPSMMEIYMPLEFQGRDV